MHPIYTPLLNSKAIRFLLTLPEPPKRWYHKHIYETMEKLSPQLGLPLYLNLLVCCQLWWIDCMLANLVWLLDWTYTWHRWCKVSPHDVLLDYCLKYSKSYFQNNMYNGKLLQFCVTLFYDFLNIAVVGAANLQIHRCNYRYPKPYLA